MNGLLVVVLTIYFPCIQTENISLNPGDEHLYSILTGDTLTLQCPVNCLKTNTLRWSYLKDKVETILYIKEKSNVADFRFEVLYTNHPTQVTYLRINNITWEETKIFKCYYNLQNTTNIEYNYTIQLANVTNSLITKQNGTVCCLVHGNNIKFATLIWEQRTLFDEHIQVIESVKKNGSKMSQGGEKSDKRKNRPLMSCLNFDKNRILRYNRGGKYICFAQLSINGRNQTINRTASFKIENIQDRPICIQDTSSQRRTLGANISIGVFFYSKPTFSALSFRKSNSELNLENISTVDRKNISLDIYNVTVMFGGYELIINITEFSEEDIGNYTVEISNDFGNSSCTVQLLSQGNDDLQINITQANERTEGPTSLQWYMMACGSFILIFLVLSVVNSTRFWTDITCKAPTMCFDKNTKEQTHKIQRRNYDNNFTEVTLNQLQNGEQRVLILGQTNEMNTTTESNL